MTVTPFCLALASLSFVLGIVLTAAYIRFTWRPALPLFVDDLTPEQLERLHESEHLPHARRRSP